MHVYTVYGYILQTIINFTLQIKISCPNQPTNTGTSSSWSTTKSSLSENEEKDIYIYISLKMKKRIYISPEMVSDQDLYLWY